MKQKAESYNFIHTNLYIQAYIHIYNAYIHTELQTDIYTFIHKMVRALQRDIYSFAHTMFRAKLQQAGSKNFTHTHS